MWEWHWKWTKKLWRSPFAPLLLILGLISGLLFPRSAGAEPIEPPNMLFLFADDMTYDVIAALGNDEIITPNLDALVGRSTTFTHAYNQGAYVAAVCRSSRDMLETGRFLWNAKDDVHQLEASRGLAPQVFADNGYETYFAGKWHLSASKAINIYDNVGTVRRAMPVDDPLGYNRPVEGQPDAWSASDPIFGGFWEGGTHWSEVLADEGIDFLRQAHVEPNPFYMQLSFNAPHDPRQAPQEYLDMYPLDSISVPENFLPENPYNELIGAGRDLRDERLAPFPRTDYAMKVHRQEYYAAITFMDAQIGRVLDELEASGQIDNTYVMFTADHGLAVGQHGFMGKQNMFEHSMRSALVMSGPTITPDRRMNNRIYYQDVMPTMFDLAGIATPAHWQFTSLLPLMRGERSENYDAIYGAYREHQRMIIDDDFKLILYPEADAALLFDLANDPLEMTNLIDDALHAERSYDLFAKLGALQVDAGDVLELAPTFAELANRGPVQEPFVAGGHTIPGPIEAEHFDYGGDGVAYYDTDAVNFGNSIRMDEGVDIWNPSAGVGHTVGKIVDGEWLEYTVDVSAAGEYDVGVVVGTGLSPGSIAVSINGVDAISGDVFPTGNWWSLQSQPLGSVSFDAGQHVMRFSMVSGGFNIDRFEFTATTPEATPTPMPMPTATPSPIGEPPPDLGYVDCALAHEAEGGALTGLMQAINDPTAAGGHYMAMPAGSGNRYALDPSNAGAYCIDVAESGLYSLEVRLIAPDKRSDSLWLQIDDEEAVVWHTGQAADWETKSAIVAGSRDLRLFHLGAGEHTLRLIAREDGTRVDSFELVLESPTPEPAVGSATCQGLIQEAENGVVSGLLTTASHSEASGGFMVGVLEGFGTSYTVNPNNAVEYCVDVPAAGVYELDLRVLAPTRTSDSIWVQIDEADPVVWHLRNHDGWITRTSKVTWSLAAGQHTVRLIAREDGTLIDRVEFRLT